MKTILNKETRIPKTENETMRYSDLLSFCVQSPSQNGYSVQDMRQRIKLLDLIEDASNEIQIEDTDFIKLKELANAMIWGWVHKDIVDFIDYINSL